MTTTVEKSPETGVITPDPKTNPKKIGLPREVYANECRVAATPETAKKLQKIGFEVLVEREAGKAANFSNEAYQEAGCQIIEDPATLWQEADIILKVRAPQYHPNLNKHEAELLSPGKTLISFIWPGQNPELLEKLAASQATVLAMDAVPRISRAQKIDALSSMANIAGYRAVVEAASHFGRFFTGQITAAGKIPPAKVLVIGAGVAGLAAIGAAKSLGAVVRGFDTRLVVKEQVRSLGAEFLELEFAEDGSGEGGYAKTMSKEFIDAEMALFAQQAKEVDIIITTALIPGKPAPVLITKEMVDSMKPGSVIVDLAAEQGGNCELTKPGEVYEYQGVTLIGLTDLPSRMASQSSQLYGNNLWHLLKEMGGAEEYHVDLEDEMIRGALVLHEGKVTWPAPKPAQPPTTASAPTPTTEVKESKSGINSGWLLLLTGVVLGVIGFTAPAAMLSHLTVFVLACFLGWMLIWNVNPALHTPLMSVTNAISGIVIVGGMLQMTGPVTSPVVILGAIAITVATINVTGGFYVTQRMLNKFRKQ
jgi:NAD(P) transhydrogenase subunit alpha